MDAATKTLCGIEATVREMDAQDQYEAGYGYPAGRWQIDYQGPQSPTSIQGFPNRETAERYAAEVCNFRRYVVEINGRVATTVTR
jgi:hypothetical protein